jgi:predicted HTH transcriptional regulator
MKNKDDSDFNKRIMTPSIDFTSSVIDQASVKDLDPSAVDVFRRKWSQALGDPGILNKTARGLLSDCGAMTKKGLTKAGIILFGKKKALETHLPHAGIVLEQRDSKNPKCAPKRFQFLNGFFSQFEEILEAISGYDIELHYRNGSVTRSLPALNKVAVRELLLNAICHRAYHVQDSITIRQSQENISIENPGGFPSDVTPQNILQIRSTINHRIYHILALAGLSKRQDKGMYTILKESLSEGRPYPKYDTPYSETVKVTMGSPIMSDALVKFLELMDFNNLSNEDIEIIHRMHHNLPLLGVSLSNLMHLVKLGIIEEDNEGCPSLTKGLYNILDRAENHESFMDYDTALDTVMNILIKKGEAGAAFKELRMACQGRSRMQLYGMMSSLRNEEKVTLVGKGRDAVWVLNKK